MTRTPRPVGALLSALWCFMPLGLGVLGGCAALCAGGCLMESPRFTRSLQTSAPASADLGLSVQTNNGSITISRGAEAMCHAAARVRALSQARADAVQVTITRADGALVVQVVWPEGGRKNAEGCDLEIRVPGSAWVRAGSDNGSVSAQGLAGVAELSTSNGIVTLRDHDGAATLTTSNGAIEGARVTGACKVHTTNGGITLVDIGGFVDASSTNGAFDIALTPENPGPVEVRTTNAPVRVRVGGSFAGTLVADTTNGSIRLPKGPTTSDLQKHAELRTARAGKDSHIRTTNGDVTIFQGE